MFNLKNFQQKIREKKEEKLICKQIEKERIRIHKNMIEQEKANINQEKISPEDSFICLQHINKIYDNHVQAVYDFNLDIKEHEFIVFVGPSGCGKSTTLRMIAGLEDITAGDLYINKVYSNHIAAKDRDIAMVFQNYALYPHLSVYENMAFSLKIKRLGNDEINRRIKEASEILQITEYLNRKPNELSGGQCQRVALGRAIVRDSKIFLMDEPLSNLDAKLRVSMRSEIIKLHQELKATTIYVTHDQTEAMTMASRIVVMNKGYIQQIGTPQEIYNHPSNLFVATFIGSPSMNIIPAYFENNNIEFGNQFKIELLENQQKLIKEFYINGLKESQKELQKIEDENVEKKMIIHRLDEIKQITPSDEKEKKNLEREVDRLNESLNIINKADKRREQLLHQIEQYRRFIESNHYEIIFGIRPSDIVESSEINHKITPSDSLSLKAAVAELLGNVYYIHANFLSQEIVFTVPADHLIKANEELEVVINLKNMHIFDKVSENIIF